MEKMPKQLKEETLPLKELKYLKSELRIILLELNNAFIFLSANKKGLTNKSLLWCNSKNKRIKKKNLGS